MDDIKEETEEGVKDEEEEEKEGEKGVNALNVTITMTPSKLPSQNDVTIIHSATPTPDQGPGVNGEGEHAGEGLLFPPVVGSTVRRMRGMTGRSPPPTTARQSE